jgi:hypothetical protein
MAPKSKGKGKNFTSSELDAMLTVVEELLPLGGDHWEHVALEYNKKVSADRVRNAESLRKKFKTLRNVKKPTGDPDCPIEVKRAKRAQYSIEAKMGVETFESGEDDELEDIIEDGNINISDEESSSDEGGDGGGAGDDDDGEPPAKKAKPPKPKPQSAAVNRVGKSTTELLDMSRSMSSSSPTPSTTSSHSGAAKKTIDKMLQDLSSSSASSSRPEEEGFMSYTDIMMWQRQDDARLRPRFF